MDPDLGTLVFQACLTPHRSRYLPHPPRRDVIVAHSLRSELGLRRDLVQPMLLS